MNENTPFIKKEPEKALFCITADSHLSYFDWASTNLTYC
jgi:hypothetical protein